MRLATKWRAGPPGWPRVQGREGVTPFAWWASRFGLWPLLLVAAALMLLTLVLRKRED